MRYLTLSLTVISFSLSLVVASGLTLSLFVYFGAPETAPKATTELALDNALLLGKTLLVTLSVMTPSAIIANINNYFEG